MSWRHYISASEWSYNLLALVAVLMPVHRRFVPPLLALAVVFALYRAIRFPASRRELRLRLREGAPMALPLLLYALLLAGCLFAGSPADASRELEYKFSFVVFPLLALLLPGLSGSSVRRILDVHVAGCLVFLLWSLGRSTWLGLADGDWSHMTYERLGFIFHPTYMSAYQDLALFHLLQRGIRREYFGSHMGLHWVICGAIVLYIALLASKAGLLVTVGMLALLPLLFLRQPGRGRRSLVAAVSLCILLAGAVWVIPQTSRRLARAGRDIVQGVRPEAGRQALSSTELRQLTWSAALEVIGSHPFGAGTANVTPLMVEIYRREGQEYAAHRRFNAHNQFLQTTAELGWPGGLALVAFFGWMGVRFFRRRDRTALFFVAMSVFHCLPESFLEVQAGIVFCCFWSLVFLRKKEDPVVDNAS